MPRRNPRPEIDHLPDGRNLILLDGIVVGTIEVYEDTTIPMGPPGKANRPEKHRVRLVTRAVGYGDFMDDGDELETAIAGSSPLRFDDEVGYFDWIGRGR